MSERFGRDALPIPDGPPVVEPCHPVARAHG